MTLETFLKAIIDFITEIIAAIQRFMGYGTPAEELTSTTEAATESV